jgi:hypothetical protein
MVAHDGSSRFYGGPGLVTQETTPLRGYQQQQQQQNSAADNESRIYEEVFLTGPPSSSEGKEKTCFLHYLEHTRFLHMP